MLDTKQKRGAAMLVSAPYRPWLSEPGDMVTATIRVVLLHFAAVAAAEVVVAVTRGCVTIGDGLLNAVAIADNLLNAMMIADHQLNTIDIVNERCSCE